ncbi:Zn-dependent exopeptidase M28, variant 2 [Balamuthia mandrillaris]
MTVTASKVSFWWTAVWLLCCWSALSGLRFSSASSSAECTRLYLFEVTQEDNREKLVSLTLQQEGWFVELGTQLLVCTPHNEEQFALLQPKRVVEHVPENALLLMKRSHSHHSSSSYLLERDDVSECIDANSIDTTDIELLATASGFAVGRWASDSTHHRTRGRCSQQPFFYQQEVFNENEMPSGHARRWLVEAVVPKWRNTSPVVRYFGRNRPCHSSLQRAQSGEDKYHQLAQDLLRQLDINRWFADVQTFSAWNRYTYGEDINEAQAWLQKELDKLPGIKVTTQSFKMPDSSLAFNVIGTLEGNSDDDIYIVGAHYDSTNYDTDPFEESPGAVDNASGTASVLEIARLFSAAGPFDATIIFILFSGEEQDLYGSKAHATKMVKDGLDDRIRFVLTMDMVGYTSQDGNYSVLLESKQVFSELVELFSTASIDYSKYGLFFLVFLCLRMLKCL